MVGEPRPVKSVVSANPKAGGCEITIYPTTYYLIMVTDGIRFIEVVDYVDA
jgi:hypothetical protein